MKKLILIIAILSCISCSNKRFYFGVDDYGEPQQFKHEFTTQGYVAQKPKPTVY